MKLIDRVTLVTVSGDHCKRFSVVAVVVSGWWRMLVAVARVVLVVICVRDRRWCLVVVTTSSVAGGDWLYSPMVIVVIVHIILVVVVTVFSVFVFVMGFLVVERGNINSMLVVGGWLWVVTVFNRFLGGDVWRASWWVAVVVVGDGWWPSLVVVGRIYILV